MRVLFILVLVTLVAACASKPKVDDESSQKITVTGTRIERSEIPPGPKLKMSLNKKNESSNFMQALAGMKSLPQPKDIGDCKGLLSALAGSNLEMRIVDENNVVLESEHGIYEYSFDDSSCPTNET
ncbi:hypothetical protein [Aliiglaciecola litoralis]|uniref:Lipoprotein n=1 Tax=Aliiglaciecola litoralis TaxID=582857 RepID=A0ABP3X6Z0_9ALTE